MIQFLFFSHYLAAHCFDEPDKPDNYYVKAILGEHHTQIDGDGEQYIDIDKVLLVIQIYICCYPSFYFCFISVKLVLEYISVIVSNRKSTASYLY